MAEIDLAALRRNADAVRASLRDPGVGMLAVLKADAYGHGAVACARALERKVWGFAVSLVEEGVELRRGGIEAPIVVLGCFYGLSHRDVVAYRLTPVVADAQDLGRLQRAGQELGVQRVQIHLKLDTGMSRLGVRPDLVQPFAASLRDCVRDRWNLRGLLHDRYPHIVADAVFRLLCAVLGWLAGEPRSKLREYLSDESLGWRAKAGALLAVFRR